MITIIVACLTIAALYFYGTRTFSYWSKRGVKYDKPLPFFGNDLRRLMMQRSILQMATDVYRRYPNERFVGFYRGTIPELVIRDPELIKHIIVNDFSYFYKRGLSPRHNVIEPLLKNLFFIDGDMWKLLRQRMTPMFSSGKLRAMFPLVCARAQRLQTSLTAITGDGATTLDARDVMARYTTDFIGSVGFGLDPDSLNDNDSEFRKLGARIFQPTLKRAVVAVCKILFPDTFKHLKFLGQKLEDDVLGLVNEIMKQRGYKPSGRNDFIDLLLELRAKGHIAVESLEHVDPNGKPCLAQLDLDDKLLAAQAFIFFAAGFETSSSATSFTLHQLAYHPEVQKRVQADIDRVLAKHKQIFSYDAIKEMTYLEWTFMEGMRMFPSAGYLSRQVTRRYTLPGSDVTLDEGVKIMIPLQALHNDPEHFDNPTEFRPERFSPEEVAKRHKFVYLPFGDGQRSCIGGRLGKMQSIAGLAAVLSRFTVSHAEQTTRELVPDPRSMIVQNVLGGVPLRFERRPVNVVQGTLERQSSRSM